VLSSEVLKLKRTLAFAMIAVAPLVIVLLYFAIGYIGAGRFTVRQTNYWLQMSQNTIGLWTLLMMPMFVTLETSLLAGLEHADNNWKNLLALPAPRWMIYISKWLVTIALLWCAHAVLVGATFASGALLRQLRPILGIEELTADPLVSSMIEISALALVALTIQHWVSLRWRSFTVAMGFGMSAMVIGFVAVNSREYGYWWPWATPILALRPRPGQADPLLLTLTASLVLAALGAWNFSRRDQQ
jgi:hypothetical protein